jgi:hypothetical protein
MDHLFCRLVFGQVNECQISAVPTQTTFAFKERIGQTADIATRNEVTTLKVKEKRTYTQKHRRLLLMLNEDGTINRKKNEKHPAVTASEKHTREMQQRRVI